MIGKLCLEEDFCFNNLSQDRTCIQHALQEAFFLYSIWRPKVKTQGATSSLSLPVLLEGSMHCIRNWLTSCYLVRERHEGWVASDNNSTMNCLGNCSRLIWIHNSIHTPGVLLNSVGVSTSTNPKEQKHASDTEYGDSREKNWYDRLE